MANSTPRQRAKRIAKDFLDSDFANREGAARWLVERIAAAIEDAEAAEEEAFCLALNLTLGRTQRKPFRLFRLPRAARRALPYPANDT